MEITQRRKLELAKTLASFCRRAAKWAIVSCALVFGPVSPEAVSATAEGFDRHTREFFRREMPQSVRADHPAILPVAVAIRAVTRNPLEQIVMVNDITHLLVDYDDDQRVYGAVEFHATLDEMLARRRQAGWIYLRDDCDGRAVFAAHLLSSLGIEWRLEASFWKQHAWIVARVNGVDYDLLDLRTDAPEIDTLSYKLIGRHFVRESRRPPVFAWRRAWAERTGRDLGVGLALGMLNIESTVGRVQQRYATDWTQKSPTDTASPVDERSLSSSIAGFPYGEPLYVGALASSSTAVPAGTSGLSMGVNTGSPSSTPTESK